MISIGFPILFNILAQYFDVGINQIYPVVFRRQMKPRANMKPGIINNILISQLQEPNHLRKWSSYTKNTRTLYDTLLPCTSLYQEYDDYLGRNMSDR